METGKLVSSQLQFSYKWVHRNNTSSKWQTSLCWCVQLDYRGMTSMTLLKNPQSCLANPCMFSLSCVFQHLFTVHLLINIKIMGYRRWCMIKIFLAFLQSYSVWSGLQRLLLFLKSVQEAKHPNLNCYSFLNTAGYTCNCEN